MPSQLDYSDDKRIEVAKHYLKNGGLSKTAVKFGVSCSSVERWVAKFKQQILSGAERKSPKILTWDVETSYMTMEYNTYDLKVYLSRHSIDHIKRDWWMLGAAWKFLGEKPIGCISVGHKDPTNDYEVIGTLHEVLSKADILVGHNSDAFDIKKFNARAITYGLPPLAPMQTIDTLKIARQNFKFSSNTLRYIAKNLGVGMKDESPDWKKVIEGCPKELAYMRKYNKQDVIVTEKVYLKLRPYMKNHPNMNVYIDQKDPNGFNIPLCPKCGSADILKADSHSYTNAGKYANYQCSSCGGWAKAKKNKVKVDLR